MIFGLIVCNNSVFCQETNYFEKLNKIGDYIHKSSKTNFPEKWEGLNREEIFSFNKNEKDVSVKYSNENKGTSITIKLYHSDFAYEGRLRKEYLSSVNFFSNDTKFSQKSIRYKGQKYTCNGFMGILSIEKNLTRVSLFECGTWLLKIKILTNELENVQVEELNNKIVNFIDPSKLTGIKKLNSKVDITFDQDKIKDESALEYIMGGAFKKLEWKNNNISENECASGFPDLYLDMHVQSIKEIAKILEKNKSTSNYFRELNLIINSGFINEFILDQYKMVMIIPENIELDFNRYNLWKSNNKVEINLNEKFYDLILNP